MRKFNQILNEILTKWVRENSMKKYDEREVFSGISLKACKDRAQQIEFTYMWNGETYYFTLTDLLDENIDNPLKVIPSLVKALKNLNKEIRQRSIQKILS